MCQAWPLSKRTSKLGFRFVQTNSHMYSARLSASIFGSSMGFREVEYFEYKADPELIQWVPSVAELLGRNTLFALRARKSGN
jgi:hypothetical protein